VGGVWIFSWTTQFIFHMSESSYQPHVRMRITTSFLYPCTVHRRKNKDQIPNRVTLLFNLKTLSRQAGFILHFDSIFLI
jgi:hypothetical protein